MKKIYLFILFLTSLIVISNNNNFPQTKDVEELSSNIVAEQSADSIAFLSQVKNESLAPVAIEEEIPVSDIVRAEAPVIESVPLSNDDYYTNVDGEKVHSPAYAPSVPAGASAICRDGTYSFSKNRRRTCSGHGGVAEWL